MRYDAELLSRRRLRVEGEGKQPVQTVKVEPLTIDIQSFDGPYDLLNQLIDKNKYHWYDIPLADITGQYLAVLKAMQELDLDLAGDFSVMAATLIHLKSRMLLPQKEGESDELNDPREELVLQLLAYRRCKFLAGQLARRMAVYDYTCPGPGQTARAAGLDRCPDEAYPPLDPAKFSEAVHRVEGANRARYQDLSDRMTRLLQRESVSLSNKIVQIWQAVRQRGRVVFSALFRKNASKTEKITGFLALLELVKRQYVRADQDRAFSAITVEMRADAATLPDADLLENAVKEYQ